MYCLETAQPRSSELPLTTWVRTTEPTFQQEPLTIEEIRRQLGVGGENTYHDPDLKGLIVAARRKVEADTGFVFYTGAHTWKQTYFPASEWLTLPKLRPITSISSITYVDSAGATQTWSSTNYTLDTGSVRPALHLTYGSFWPTVRGDINGITVTAVAGFASIPAVPEELKTAVVLAARVLWKLKMDAEWKSDQEGYERWITGSLRESYP